ncbi:MAG TPA: FAD-binding oxidoreductase [Polyangiaceae bacterium]|nr:FAD-binding oxidoreductase [Polyangiaceae bacterium]
MMRATADVVVIGAGIMGLAVAYELSRLTAGKLSVVVVDASYLCGGASGRNGGGVRAQWSDALSVELMKESLAEFRSFARRHRINTWFRAGGYLFLARTDARAKELAHSVEVQRGAGLDTRLLAPNEVNAIVPELSTSGVLVASYNPDDAVVFPWPIVWGYAEGARALGVEIHTFTRVTGIEVQGGRIAAVETDRGRVQTSTVVLAAGAHSPEVARLAGVELPTRPHRHEICATEPLKPWLTPLVADLTDGLYFSQSTRGEIVGGIGNDRVPEGPVQTSSGRFLALYARALVTRCPHLGAVRVLRQWAGLYDISPDQRPIVGSAGEPEGLFLTSGFMGHGFMMAPVIGKRLARWIARGEMISELRAWTLSRFREGRLLEGGMIIG